MSHTDLHSEQLPRYLQVSRSDGYTDACRGIADILCTHATWARDGNVCWRNPLRPAAGLQPGFIGPHLFPGTLGVALFLAAAGNVLGEEALSLLARHALEPLRREIRDIAAHPALASAVKHPIGGLTGLGSLVYGLTRIGDLLGDPGLLDDAQAVTGWITEERIAEDDQLDVMMGAAGTLLALLAFAERRPDAKGNGSTPLELALACARRLASERGRPLPSGFCHGSAGISSALSRLYAQTGKAWLQEAAEELLADERALWMPAARNWKMSAQGEPRLFNSWCKGAPGIVLGRLSLLDLSADPLVAEEISAGLHTTARGPLSATDDLCCGNAGRVDVLVEAHRRLGDPDLLESARELADALLERARRQGFYSIRLRGEIVLDARFFPGLAGLGYSLLRLIAAERLPCVAAMM